MNRYGLLSPDDIECRVQQISAKGLSLLLYKNARVDAQILDEVDGSENWQCRFYERKGTLFCSLGVRHGDTWVWKDDAGAPSNMESQKGEASDAFKRAGFKHGIGRELYSAPFIWLTPDCANIKANGQKYVCYDRFKVTDIDYSGDRISSLEIYNESLKQTVYTWGSKTAGRRISKKDAMIIVNMLEDEKIDCAAVWKLYKVNAAIELTEAMATNIKQHMDELKARYGK